MLFADMVLARGLLRALDERLVLLILDGLDGEGAEVSDEDRAAIAAFTRALRHEFGPVPAATEIEVAFAVGRYAELN
jgi:hypothetical protein